MPLCLCDAEAEEVEQPHAEHAAHDLQRAGQGRVAVVISAPAAPMFAVRGADVGASVVCPGRG